MEITSHFTSTVLVVCQDRVLLHQHKEFNCLLPVAGHVERDVRNWALALRAAQGGAG